MAGTKILVVDDEQLIRWSLRWHLEQAGHGILEAATGQQALERLADGPDLVLLDLRLPDTDGLAVLERIRRERPALPVILMTAHGAPAGAGAARRLGAFAVLDKPFDFGAILGLVERALAGRSPAEP